MKVVKNLKRIIYINYVLLKHGLSPLPLLRRNRLPEGIRIRQACEELGPIFIKVGQMLSTRADLLPEDIVNELSKLQDQVSPFPGSAAQKIIEQSLGAPIHELFATFDINPLASASIAQVHAATLHDGTAVVIKVLRPNIRKLVMQDMDVILLLAKIIDKYWSLSKTLRPYEVILELKKNLDDELDLMREAANASQLRRNFNNSHLLYVPTIYWSHTRSDVFTMERLYGIPISDIAELKAQGTDLKRLSERGVEIFFTQVFRDCFFHADMHPGNVWVSKETPTEPKYLALDFGIIGTLGPQDQYYLAENFLAFFKRDYRRVAELHIESGWVPRDTRLDEFESAIRAVCEPIFEKPLSDISFGKILLSLFQTARRFDMRMQPQLILLQKTLISVEGLGRQLYPDLDLWNTAKPFLEDWVRSRVGSSSLIRKLRTQAPYWLEKLPDLPALIYKTLQHNSQPNMLAFTNNQITAKQVPFWYYFILGIASACIAAVVSATIVLILR